MSHPQMAALVLLAVATTLLCGCKKDAAPRPDGTSSVATGTPTSTGHSDAKSAAQQFVSAAGKRDSATATTLLLLESTCAGVEPARSAQCARLGRGAIRTLETVIREIPKDAQSKAAHHLETQGPIQMVQVEYTATGGSGDYTVAVMQVGDRHYVVFPELDVPVVPSASPAASATAG